MSKRNNLVIQFTNLHQLWQFAQAINASFIEIRTKECILVCSCFDNDLELLEKYDGKVVKEENAINN